MTMMFCFSKQKERGRNSLKRDVATGTMYLLVYKQEAPTSSIGGSCNTKRNGPYITDLYGTRVIYFSFSIGPG